MYGKNMTFVCESHHHQSVYWACFVPHTFSKTEPQTCYCHSQLKLNVLLKPLLHETTLSPVCQLLCPLTNQRQISECSAIDKFHVIIMPTHILSMLSIWSRGTAPYLSSRKAWGEFTLRNNLQLSSLRPTRKLEVMNHYPLAIMVKYTTLQQK